MAPEKGFQLNYQFSELVMTDLKIVLYSMHPYNIFKVGVKETRQSAPAIKEII